MISKNLFKKDRNIFILLGTIGTLLYLFVLNGPFLWDDVGIILENKYVTSFKYFPDWFAGENVESLKGAAGNLYRPLVTMVYCTIYSIFGASQIPYHLFNLVIHIFNSCFVFKIFEKLKFSRIGSLIIALIFLIHPVQTASVSYIAGTPDVLAPFFILLGLLFFLRKNLKSYVISALCGVAALLSKEIGIVFLPLIILLIIFNWKNYSKEELKDAWKFTGIIIVITGLYLFFRLSVLTRGEILGLNPNENEYTGSPVLRLLTFVEVLPEYAKMVFAPIHLHFERVTLEYFDGINLRNLFGLTVILLGLAGSILSFKKTKKVFLAFLWAAITIAPVSGIIPSNATHREHWLYLPIIGIGILIAILWETLKTKRAKQTFSALLIIAALALSTLTIHRNLEWADADKFFQNEIEHTIYPTRVYSRYGKIYFERGNSERAAELFQEGIDAAFPNDRMLVSLHYNLGEVYLTLNKPNRALKEYLKVFELDSNYLNSHIKLEKIFRMGNAPEKADAFGKFVERIKNGEEITFEEIVETKKIRLD